VTPNTSPWPNTTASIPMSTSVMCPLPPTRSTTTKTAGWCSGSRITLNWTVCIPTGDVGWRSLKSCVGGSHCCKQLPNGWHSWMRPAGFRWPERWNHEPADVGRSENVCPLVRQRQPESAAATAPLGLAASGKPCHLIQLSRSM